MALTETKKLLPSVFQTETNDKFLGATVDNLVTEPNLKAINGFVGRKFSPEFSSFNEYIRESSISRTNYQLEPSIVVKDQNTGEVSLHRSYQEFIQDIRSEGGIVNEPNRLFSSEYLSYNPQINLDCFSNYFEYYWIPNGPALVEINETINIANVIGKENFTTTSNINLTNGLKIKFTGNVDTNFKNKEYYVEGVGNSIELIPSVELSINQSQQKSNYDPTDSFTYTVTANLNTNESSDKITVTSTGIPDNQEVFANIDGLSVQSYEFVYPYRGGLNVSKENDPIITSSQLIAVSTVGIPYYGISNDWKISLSGGVTKTYDSIFSNLNIKDEYGGEATAFGAYFYRDASPVLANAWGGTNGYSDGYTDSVTGHSKIVGFAADGYPIYGPFGYSDPGDSTSNVTRMTSSYTTSINEQEYPPPVEVKINLIDSINPTKLLLVSSVGLNPAMKLTKINGVSYTGSVKIINNSQSTVTGAPLWEGELNQIELSTPVNLIINPSTGSVIKKDDLLTFEFIAGTFIEDYVYEENLGTLDEFNGRFCVTPEYPLGTYAYFTTINEDNVPVFPYIIGRTYRGSTTIEPNESLTTPNYITINRGSQDRNPWSRRNRWFHRSVIELANSFSNAPIDITQYTNAKRPIIEFNKNLQLYNYGRLSAGSIDLIDLTTTNAFKDIELQQPAKIDDITVINGMRLVFANDEDLSIRNKIWQVNIVTIDSIDVVHLEEVISVDANNTIIVFNGDVNVNKNFWFDGTNWREGQQWQGNTSEPLFDVVDDNDISFSNNDFYPSYDPNLVFSGNKIFNYRQLSTSATDPYVGLKITYKNLNNLGDIEFENSFENKTFGYRVDNTNYTKKVSSGFLVKNNGDSREFVTVWTPAQDTSHQYQIISYIYDGIDPNFIIDINSVPDDEHKHFKVYVNYEAIDETMYSIYSLEDTKSIVYVSRTLEKNDKIDIVIYSRNTSKLGYYEIPENLEFNALNEDFTSITLGDFRNHVGHMVEHAKLIDGNFPGISNLRDVNILNVGGTIVRQVNPLNYASLFLAKNKFNFISALNYAKTEYAGLKNKILTLAEDASNSSVFVYGGQREALDLILKEITKNKTVSSPWYSSDMIPFGDDFNKISYTVIDTAQRKYPITEIFNDEKLSNRATLVYVNNTLVVKDIDYTFDKDISVITFSDSIELTEDSTIDIFEYNNTDGSFCPETPTKLGLFPRYVPQIIDDVTPTSTRKFIRGHDGSLTLAFNDFRDDILLEFETRIYNNIKLLEKPHLQNFYWNKPGKFRKTVRPYDFTLDEFNAILSREFYNWLRVNNIEDYTTNNIYKEYITDETGNLPVENDGTVIYTNDPNRFFSYNYKNTKDLDGEFLPGSWRACFDYYYDTYTPHQTPWEMLGFAIKPTWWESEYGPAPYTAGNEKLWQDLEEGRILHGDRSGVDLNFARPGLLSIIPVDDVGTLIAPANLFAGERTQVDASWIFGNWGPIEWAWRRSSEFSFAWQLATALTQPAKYFTFGANTEDYIFDNKLNQYVINETKKQITKSDIKINSSEIKSASFINWIKDFLISNGIINQNLISDYINNHSVQLSYRLAGFSDKLKLKMIAEQYSPQLETRGVLIPDEDYDLTISESAPIITAIYSAIKIERVQDGYKVSGYNNDQPYFSIISPDFNGRGYDIKVINEQVRYYEEFLQNLRVVYYNTVFRTKQQVVNFIIGYQRYLEIIGFEFEDYDQLLETTKNWQLSIKEFLYWSQQGWKDKSIITISPVGSKINYRYPTGVVAEIENLPLGSKILNQNGEIISKNAYNVNRRGNQFSLTLTKPIENNISLAKLNIVQQEHVVIFKNQTQFKDIIYNPVFGQRQFRIKIVGKKTANWTGSLSPEGFIINEDNIEEWYANTDYKRGTIVQYKNFYYVAKENVIGSEEFNFTQWKPIDYDTFKFGLLPNFATISSQSNYYFDVDRINLESDFDQMSIGLIGYRNRNYFLNAGLNDSTQVKLYQGITKQKGTKNAIDSVSKLYNGTKISEEWAFKVGEYGYLSNNESVDIRLSESLLKGNPVTLTIGENNQIIYLNNKSDNNGIVDFSSTTSPTEIFKEESEIVNPISRLKTAGFVNYNDIDHTLFSFNDTTNLNLNSLKSGETIWVAVDNNQDWNVYKIINSKVNIVKISNLFNSTLLVETNKPHKISENSVIILKTNDQFSGFYSVDTILNPKQFIIRFDKELPTDFVSNDYQSIPLYYLQSVKISYPSEINTVMESTDWINGDKIWATIPNTKQWQVFEKTDPWQNLNVLVDRDISEQGKFGNNFAVSDDKKSMISVPINTENNYKFLNFYIYDDANSQFRFFNKVELPTFLQSIEEIQKLIFKTNYLFVLCLISNKQYILIFQKIGENLLQFQQVLQIIPTADTAKFSVSDDETSLFFDTKDQVASREKVVLYTRQNTQIQDFTIEITGEKIYLLDDEVEFDFVEVQSGFYNYIRDIDYRLFEFSGKKYIEFTFVPDDILVVLTARPKFIIDSELIISSGVRSVTNLSSGGSNDHVVIKLQNEKNVKVIGRYREKYVYSSLTSRIVTTTSMNNTTKVFVGTSQKTLNVDYLITNPNTIQFIGSNLPLAGNIITIVFNKLEIIQELETEFINNNFEFGDAVEISKDKSFVYASSPLYSENQSYEIGIAERWVNYGLITNSFITEPLDVGFIVSDPFAIKINDFPVTFNFSRDAQTIVNQINNLLIPGITASLLNDSDGLRIKILNDENVSLTKLDIRPIYNPTTIFAPYVKLSNIKNPTKVNYDQFGKSILLDKTNNLILIGSPEGTAVQATTFDVFSSINVRNDVSTTFDNNLTLFEDLSKSGCIWSFNNLYGSLESKNSVSEPIYINQLHPRNLDNSRSETVRFSELSEFKGNLLTVGAPNVSSNEFSVDNHGLIFYVKQSTDGWQEIRNFSPAIDLRSINKLFVYSNSKKQILYGLDYIDPVKGKILGIADQDIDYKTEYDPAVYNNGTNTGSYFWNDEYIGKVWWDLSTVRFVDYEQGDLKYRSDYWGSVFEGSSIDVYEWVESNYPPNLYQENGGDGEPRSINNFTTIETVDENLGTIILKYYFWVKNKTSVPNNVKNRRLPIETIANIIENPKSSGIKFLAPIAKNSITLYNVYEDLIENDRILKIYYNSIPEKNTNQHVEYKLLNEDSSLVKEIPKILIDKLIDSFSGIDENLNDVPDRNLPLLKKNGILNNPRQSIYTETFSPRVEFFIYLNSIFKKYKLADRYNLTSLLFGEQLPSENLTPTDDILYDLEVNTYAELLYINRVITSTGYRVLIKTDENTEGIWAIYQLNSDKEWERVRCQSWNTQEFWNYINWWEDGYDDTTREEFVFDSYADFQRRSIYEINEFTIIDGGSGYSDSDVQVTIVGGGAKTQSIVGKSTRYANGSVITSVGKPTIENGRIKEVTLLTTGSGYISQPRVNVTGSNSSPAIINAKISTERGRIIKILNDGFGRWNYLRTTESGYEVIGIERGTIAISRNIFDFAQNNLGFDNDNFDGSRFDKNQQQELRKIFFTLYETIFADQLEDEFLKLFFFMMKVALIQQKSVDWMFKTSFIDIKQNLGELDQRKIYSPRDSTMLREYIDEVKPYKTVVREYKEGRTKLDNVNNLITDFDVVPYFDSTLNLFRSPQYQSNGNFIQDYPQDQSAFDDIIYDSWKQNFSYYISDAKIVNGGSGFTPNTVFQRTVTNPNGDDAIIEFTVGFDGSIAIAKIINSGSGFVTTPTISLENDAKIAFYVSNDFVRKVKTTIKYDRVSYGKEPREWLPNREYKQFEIIKYVSASYAQNLNLQITGNVENSQVLSSIGFDGDSAIYDFYGFDVEEEDIFIPGKSWIALRNFNSGNSFKPISFINIDGNVEQVAILEPYENFVSIRVWQPNTEFYQDQIVVFRNVPYLVTSKFTSGDVFSGTNLDKTLASNVLNNPINDNAANRILVYYNPVTGRPGRDLSALMAGVDYPGIIIRGIGFEVSGGFDVSAFDLYPFDQTSIDQFGNQIFADEELDSITDGIGFNENIENAEIIIDGDGFVTPDYSYAPEELLPGRVYDTMDMKIVTLSVDATDTTYITWINGDAYTLSGFIGTGGSNIASANLTFTGYTVVGNVWLEPNLGITYETNTVVINNLPIVSNSVDIANITIDANNQPNWIYVSNVVIETTSVANTVAEEPKLWPNLIQSNFTTKFNYHIWKDLNDVNEYLATNISNIALLVSNLEANLTYANIEVNNAALLPEPSIVVSVNEVAAAALNRRMDSNSVNYITNVSNVTLSNIENAVYEVYGNVQFYQANEIVITSETIYNPKEGIYMKPGVIMINGERMEYWSKFNDSNILVGVRRGTRGTSVLEHYAGEKVYDYTRTVPNVGFETWTPTVITPIQTQKEDTYLNFNDIITESGNLITTESNLIIATDGNLVSGLGSYIFENDQEYTRTRIFNLPTPGPNIITEDGNLIILDGISPDVSLESTPPTYPTDGRGLYNSGISSPNVASAVFVVNSLYDE